MFDCTTPPEIPQSVIEYADKIESSHTRKLAYITDWGNYHLYVLKIMANYPKEIVTSPLIILHDGNNTRITNKEERQRLYFYAFPKYFPTSCEQIYYLHKKD